MVFEEQVLKIYPKGRSVIKFNEYYYSDKNGPSRNAFEPLIYQQEMYFRNSI